MLAKHIRYELFSPPLSLSSFKAHTDLSFGGRTNQKPPVSLSNLVLQKNQSSNSLNQSSSSSNHPVLLSSNTFIDLGSNIFIDPVQSALLDLASTLIIPSKPKAKQADGCPLVEQMKDFFRRFDCDKDGRLSKEELKKAFNELGSRVPVFRTLAALRHADENGDGFISKE
ncbi:hypothetical protein DITRI_Ditri09bG0011100 [Diplodiscus trichospermus]